MAVYFLLGLLSVFSLTPSIHFIGIYSDDSFFPLGNPLCWFLFIVFIALNFGTLIEIYLDYKEARAKNNS